MVVVIQRSAPADCRAAAAACSAATLVLMRVLGLLSRAWTVSIAARPASIRAARAAASRAALLVEWTQITRYPSAEEAGAWKVRQTRSGSSRRAPGVRRASVQAGVWVWAQSRNQVSSRRPRGTTVTKRPPRAWMWAIACCEHSLLSAT